MAEATDTTAVARPSGAAAGLGRPSVALRLAGAALLLLALQASAYLGRPIYGTVMVNDAAMFVDAAQRVRSGLVPHLDFGTSLGALCFYGPALFGLVDDPFRAFGLFRVVALAVVLGLGLYAALSRGLDTLAGTVLLVFLAAVVGMPGNTGAFPWLLTFAMWYNKLAWAFLLIGAVLLLPPVRNGAALRLADAAVILLLGLGCFYLKATYAVALAGLFGLGFLLLPHLRRPALLAALGCVVVLGVVEVVTGGMNAAYLDDLRESAAVNRTRGLDLGLLLKVPGKAEAVEVALAVAAAGLYLAAWRDRAAWRYLLLFVLLYVAGVVLSQTNNQARWIIAPFAVPLIAYVRGLRLTRDGEAPRAVAVVRPTLVLPALATLLVVYALPETLLRFASLGLYAAERQAANAFPAPPILQNGLVADEGSAVFLARIAAGEDPRAVLAERRAAFERDPPYSARWGDDAIYQTEYLYTVARGAFLLDDVQRRLGRGPVVVFDFTNLFSAILDLPPARGEYAWYHWTRNLDRFHHRPAEAVLANARYVAVPKFAVNPPTRDFLRRTYGPYLDRRFAVAADGPLWRIWARR